MSELLSSKEVVRYCRGYGDMERDKYGTWVRYDDFERLQQDVARYESGRVVLTGEIDTLKKQLSARLQQIEELRMAERLNVETVARLQQERDDLQQFHDWAFPQITDLQRAQPPEACEHGAHPPRNCSICTGQPAEPPDGDLQKTIYGAALIGLQNLLCLAVSHIDTKALRISHEKDWAALSPFARLSVTKEPHLWCDCENGRCNHADGGLPRNGGGCRRAADEKGASNSWDANGSPVMAMLPNDHHPGPRCSCRACQVRYPEETGGSHGA